MDKLKPILAQHFWILFVVVMILPIFGWWGATAGFVAETTEMRDKVEQAFSSVSYGENIPNDTWAGKVTPYIKRQEERNKESLEACWAEQVPLMKWPDTLRVPDTFYGEFSAISRNIYRAEYPLEVERVWKVVDPFIPEEGKGTILFGMSRFPHRVFGDLPPSSQQMWEAQQDLWLFESLFKAIRKVNEGSTIVTDSAIRSIETIKLVGGSGEPVVEQVAGTADASSDTVMTQPTGARFGGSSSVTFDPASELGPSADPNAGSSDDSSSSDTFTEPGTSNVAAEGLRYVGPQEGGTYLKRGFYLEVVMQHNRVSDLLIELSNADFPVAIKRFQFAANGANLSGTLSAGVSSSGDPYSEEFSSGSGGSGTGFGSSTTRRTLASGNTFNNNRNGRSQNIEQAALASGQLVRVAICGVMVLYNPPPKPEAEETPATDVPPEPEEGTAEENMDSTSESADAPMTDDGNSSETNSNEGTDKPSTASESTDDTTETIELPEGDAPEKAPAVPEVTPDNKSDEAPAAPKSDEKN